MNCVCLSSCMYLQLFLPKTSNKLWDVVDMYEFWSQRRYQRLWTQPVKVLKF